MNYVILVANKSHLHHAEVICDMIQGAARIRKTGIAKRAPLYIQQKMLKGLAVIALANDQVVGFCYVESWENKKYVVNSGLIVRSDHRKTGLARAIKQRTFQLSKELFPESRIFGITTSLAVMRINSELGYKPVTFSELTQDDGFWSGCASCANYDILQRTQRSMCLCTAMVAEPSESVKAEALVSPEKSWDLFQQFLARGKQGLKNKFKKLTSPIFQKP